jgi:putative transposase
VVVTIGGKRFWLWRAVDSEGEVLDLLVQSRRNTAAAIRLMRKLLRKQGLMPDVIITDQLRSYGAAVRDLGFQFGTSKASARITGPKIRVSRPDDASL